MYCKIKNGIYSIFVKVDSFYFLFKKKKKRGFDEIYMDLLLTDEMLVFLCDNFFS